MIKNFFIIIFIITFITSGCTVVGIRNFESPAYVSKIIDQNYELRDYDSYLTAETYVIGSKNDDDAFDTVTNIGFRRLADYIFGENYKRGVMFRGSQPIDMTMPVIVDHPAPSDNNKWRVAFVIPDQWTLGTVPVPKQIGVYLKQIESYQIVSIRFSGLVTTEKIKKYEKDLRIWANDRGLKIKPQVRTAIYDPRWTIPFLRRNEVHLFVDISADSTETDATCCSTK
jgi:hypothetical protein